MNLHLAARKLAGACHRYLVFAMAYADRKDGETERRESEAYEDVKHRLADYRQQVSIAYDYPSAYSVIAHMAESIVGQWAAADISEYWAKRAKMEHWD